MTCSRQSRSLLKLSVSTLVLSTALVGCKPATFAQRPYAAGQRSAPLHKLEAQVSDKAARALATGDFVQAVTLAENLVAASPRDAGYRTLLGQAYLRAGRFVAADEAFADVIRLMPDNDKARVAQAVARIASGNRAGAMSVLAEVHDAPADDYGLALALAGEPEKALAVLEPAARGMRGTSRTRQNLALAYALAGQWDKARVVASQDVSPADVDRRMEDWARLASPDARATQVATLLGTKAVVNDPGQPVMLALEQPRLPEPAATAVAAAPITAPVMASAPAPAFAPATPLAAASAQVATPVQTAVASLAPSIPSEPSASVPAAMAAAGAAQAPVASAIQPRSVNQPLVADAAPAALTPAIAEPAVAAAAQPQAPVIAASIAHNIPSARASMPAPIPVAVPPSLAARTPGQARVTAVTSVAFHPTPLRPQAKGDGGWVVQLAAYKSAGRVEAGWVVLKDNFKRLGQYAPSQSTYTVSATGAVYHRLSVPGFASRGAAMNMCQSIRSQGGSCFVRRDIAEAPMQMASRQRERLAGL